MRERSFFDLSVNHEGGKCEFSAFVYHITEVKLNDNFERA